MSKFSTIITEEDGIFVVYCPELDITSQGKTRFEAEENLREAINLYFEDEDSSSSFENPVP